MGAKRQIDKIARIDKIDILGGRSRAFGYLYVHACMLRDLMSHIIETYM